MNKRNLIYLVALIIIVAGFSFAFISPTVPALSLSHHENFANKNSNVLSQEISGDNSSTNYSGEISSPKISRSSYDSIKAIYATGWVTGTSSMRQNLINNILDNGFNAIVIDIKDEAGHLSYNSSIETAKNIGASKNMIKDIKSVINEFHEKEIYVIGRIVTFKDPTYASKVPSIAYKNAEGSIWKDYSNNSWPNPYNKDSWEYPIALAKEAATLGFDEIQFDYIRFPSSEGRVKQIAYGFDSQTKTKSQIINEFLQTVMDEMADFNIKISADVFGIITKKDGDFENIGQDYKSISKIVDVVCPMVYPSHYAKGEYKIAKPDLSPYGIVYAAMNDAALRVSGESNIAVSRPYIQDFTASWLGKGNYQVYGINAVKDQIQALYDLGIESFTLWDPNNKYEFEALKMVSGEK